MVIILPLRVHWRSKPTSHRGAVESSPVPSGIAIPCPQQGTVRSIAPQCPKEGLSGRKVDNLSPGAGRRSTLSIVNSCPPRKHNAQQSGGVNCYAGMAKCRASIQACRRIRSLSSDTLGQEHPGNPTWLARSPLRMSLSSLGLGVTQERPATIAAPRVADRGS